MKNRRYGDHFYKKAKNKGFLARSIFKLEEIDIKYKLFPQAKPKDKQFIVIDLGCSPGSWLQYALDKTNDNDIVIGIDLNSVKINNNRLIFIQDDINNITSDILKEKINSEKVDLVLSDMAPKTSGIKINDQQRSLELCMQALRVAKDLLKENGSMLVKIFQGPDINNFIGELKQSFKEIKKIKPESSRKESFEIYILAKGFTQ